MAQPFHVAVKFVVLELTALTPSLVKVLVRETLRWDISIENSIEWMERMVPRGDNHDVPFCSAWRMCERPRILENGCNACKH